MSERLQALARRLENDPAFVACALRHFARSDALDDRALAVRLGCTLENLLQIRLCQTPNMDQFAQDIDRIVERFEADGEQLSQAIRLGLAIHNIQGASGSAGMFLAARDADDEPREDKP